jgi:hypothetical protein
LSAACTAGEAKSASKRANLNVLFVIVRCL